MADFKFYNDYGGGTYLELHDNHTLWKIDKAFDFDEYYHEVSKAIFAMENRYKDLEVFQLGRSGRHICVPDTPTNRRRYKALVQYAEQLEQVIINHFNNKEDLIMKQYVCENEISRYDFDRINKLMDVMFGEYEINPEMHKLIDELDARPDTMPYGFYFKFDDDSKIYIDICSGSSNYYDNCQWVSGDCNEDYVFDCSYEISEENKFIHNNTSYICKFIIKED